MALYKDEGVVLRTMRLGEADRIITFVTRASGKVRAVAKGIRRTKSRFGGRLEPFCQVSLVLWEGRSGLDTVTSVEVVEPFRKIREDLYRFALGEVMLEATDKVVQDREPLPGAFALLIDSLRRLSQGASPEVLAAFLLRLCRVAGFAPSLTGCTECGGVPAAFSPGLGGAVCSEHRTPDDLDAPGRLMELMHELASEGAWREAPPEAAAAAVSLARRYTEYHLERRLRSAGAAEGLMAGS